jgi:hypothetical protein
VHGFQVRIFSGIDPATGKQLIRTGSAATEVEAITMRHPVADVGNSCRGSGVPLRRTRCPGSPSRSPKRWASRAQLRNVITADGVSRSCRWTESRSATARPDRSPLRLRDRFWALLDELSDLIEALDHPSARGGVPARAYTDGWRIARAA